MRTNIKGILAAGDITGLENQLVVACAKGTLAALTAAKYLRENEPWTFKPVN
jgi:thioredoxin reductase